MSCCPEEDSCSTDHSQRQAGVAISLGSKPSVAVWRSESTTTTLRSMIIASHKELTAKDVDSVLQLIPGQEQHLTVGMAKASH